MFVERKTFIGDYSNFSEKKDDISITKRPLTKDYSLHWHDYFEIECIISGSAEIGINGHKFVGDSGTAYLLTPVDYHEIKVLTSPCILCHIVFKEEMIQKSLSAKCLEMESKHMQLTEEAMSVFSFFSDQLLSEFSSDNSFRQEAMKNLLESIVILLLRHVQLKKNILPYSDYVYKTLLYLHTHYSENPSMECIAEQVHLHPNYLNKQFHEAIGMPVKKYLNHLKLSYAKKTLLSTTMSISEVCYASGFNSLSHFIREFKKNFLYSPQEYRQKFTEKKKEENKC